MTQATHTPGPWRIVSDGISHWIEIEPNKIALVKAKKADRDLIAAAPDMLAALQLLIDEYGNGGMLDGTEIEAVVLAAIAKAVQSEWSGRAPQSLTKQRNDLAPSVSIETVAISPLY